MKNKLLSSSSKILCTESNCLTLKYFDYFLEIQSLHNNTVNFFVFVHSRSSPPDVFLGKGVPKICSKFTGEHLCRSVISVKLLYNFIEIALRHGCSLVNLLHIFRTPFPTNTSVRAVSKIRDAKLFLKFPSFTLDKFILR